MTEQSLTYCALFTRGWNSVQECASTIQGTRVCTVIDYTCTGLIPYPVSVLEEADHISLRTHYCLQHLQGSRYGGYGCTSPWVHVQDVLWIGHLTRANILRGLCLESGT